MLQVKEVRQARGMSQLRLAEAAGVSRTTIWHMERYPNHPVKTETLEKIAGVLGCKVVQLIRG